jgi:hypothetical protein
MNAAPISTATLHNPGQITNVHQLMAHIAHPQNGGHVPVWLRPHIASQVIAQHAGSGDAIPHPGIPIPMSNPQQPPQGYAQGGMVRPESVAPVLQGNQLDNNPLGVDSSGGTMPPPVQQGTGGGFQIPSSAGPSSGIVPADSPPQPSIGGTSAGTGSAGDWRVPPQYLGPPLGPPPTGSSGAEGNLSGLNLKHLHPGFLGPPIRRFQDGGVVNQDANRMSGLQMLRLKTKNLKPPMRSPLRDEELRPEDRPNLIGWDSTAGAHRA